ncbi:MAG TPA: hypothetical protein PLI70_02115 [Gemmatimonadales bacterium]|nr:hypothetical protein [Gemmatimonadales bacterium]HRZ08617.1 hypothetical protein [Gemmatimonadales bacterium]
MTGALLLALAASLPGQEPGVAQAVELEVERIAAAQPLWPGFDPLSVPLAIYDGQQTWLFRHPKPPAPFAGPVASAQVAEGRFPAITSNSSAEIGGVMTATLLADGPRGQRPPADLAAVALHEAFHVYQRVHHRGWSGNEGDLLVYPVTNPDLLASRRLESAALERALANTEAGGAACWARVALAYRRERFAAIDSAFVAYERLTELNEGLAAYVQLRASGGGVTIPPAEFLPEAVRLRAYTIGPALAVLLDRLSPGWQQALKADDTQSLDGLLASALDAPGAPTSASCAFTPVEVGAAKRDARIDAGEVTAGWGQRQRAFETKEGWRVVIQSAKGQPLWPQGFDPLNVDRVDGALIHTRFLKLGNGAGQMTAIDEAGADVEARTEGIGPHPIFNGVSWVEVVLSVRPTVSRAEGTLTIKGPGFAAEFRNATLDESGRQLLVQLN